MEQSSPTSPITPQRRVPKISDALLSPPPPPSHPPRRNPQATFRIVAELPDGAEILGEATESSIRAIRLILAAPGDRVTGRPGRPGPKYRLWTGESGPAGVLCETRGAAANLIGVSPVAIYQAMSKAVPRQTPPVDGIPPECVCWCVKGIWMTWEHAYQEASDRLRD